MCFLYNTLINGYCLDGRMDKTMELLTDMVSIGLRPNDVTYNALIHGYSNKGKIEDGLALFKEMLSKGVKPDSITYTTRWVISIWLAKEILSGHG
jgi:pentatricopeptide repeat protein